MRIHHLFEEKNAPLEAVVQQIADYIQHNESVDFRAIAEVIHGFGYIEPVRQTEFYRCLFHPLSASDRKLPTLGDVAERYRALDGMGMRQGDIEGFSATQRGVMRFAYGTLAHSVNRTHTPDTPAATQQEIGLIYTVQASPASIVLSMRGLIGFLPKLPQSRAQMALKDALNDMDQGYSGDDEVLIDTSKDVRIIAMDILDVGGDD